jgi:hypothetical protein
LPYGGPIAQHPGRKNRGQSREGRPIRSLAPRSSDRRPAKAVLDS